MPEAFGAAAEQQPALWVRVDPNGIASYGGLMPVPEVVKALRFLADHIEAEQGAAPPS